ncbi:MAG: glycosyltransferase [Phycisphaerales bacterium]
MPPTPPHPGIVVIGRNEGERLVRCLRSVAATDRPVVYVDSGSTDGSVAQARSLGADVVELDMSRPFSAARGRNAGLARLLALAPGTAFVQFVDGDCEVDPAWIDTAAAALESDPRLAAVCGRLRERHPEASIYNRLCDAEWDAPAGDVRACGGNAMYRVEAFTAVGGFNEAVIAGEEPELCYRLRHAGHTIRRLPADMALHDADMHRFAQWWKRAARGGWAMAHGAALHGRTPERFNVRRIRSVLFWAMLVPIAAVLWMLASVTLVQWWGPSAVRWAAPLAGLVFPLLYAALWLKMTLAQRARGRSLSDAALLATFTLLAKFAELTGIIRFWRSASGIGAAANTSGTGTPAFDKAAAGSTNASAAILYISSILPARSETFVYREVFALRARGLTIHTASVNAPERDLGEPRLDQLAASAIPIYATGPAAFLLDLFLESLTHPIRTASTKLRAIADILTCDDVRWTRRPRLYVQALAALVLARRIRRTSIRPAARGGRAFQPDRITRIHAHMAHVPATIAMYAARHLDIPFSFTGHANDIFPNRSLLRTKLRRAAFVACISEWHQRFYHDLSGVPLDRLPVIRCGVDVPDATATEARNRATDLRSPRSKSVPPTDGPPPFHILAVGRLIPKKGFDILLDAVALLQTRRPDLAARLNITIVGDGPEMPNLRSKAAAIHDTRPDAGPEEALRRRSGSSNDGPPIRQPAITLLGAQPNPRVRALMLEADLFALPCRVAPGGDRDGIPVVLMEAMAAGVPAISGRLPAIEELIEHDATGLLVEPGDATALAAALERLMDDPSLRARLAAAGRQRVIDEFSEAANIPRLMQALGLQPTPQPVSTDKPAAALSQDTADRTPRASEAA